MLIAGGSVAGLSAALTPGRWAARYAGCWCSTPAGPATVSCPTRLIPSFTRDGAAPAQLLAAVWLNRELAQEYYAAEATTR